MTEHTTDLGKKLKSHRTARGLTLEQLAQSAGVSKAMLSQIEKDKVNPTVAIMLKIADALGVGIGELIQSARSANVLRVIPAEDSHYTFRAEEDCTIRTLSPLSLEKHIEFYRITLAPAGKLSSEAHFRGCQELLHVARGRVTVTSGSETITLNKGDSAHYRADVPHTIENTGRTDIEAYLIVLNQS